MRLVTSETRSSTPWRTLALLNRDGIEGRRPRRAESGERQLPRGGVGRLVDDLIDVVELRLRQRRHRNGQILNPVVARRCEGALDRRPVTGGQIAARQVLREVRPPPFVDQSGAVILAKNVIVGGSRLCL